MLHTALNIHPAAFLLATRSPAVQAVNVELLPGAFIGNIELSLIHRGGAFTTLNAICGPYRRIPTAAASVRIPMLLRTSLITLIHRITAAIAPGGSGPLLIGGANTHFNLEVQRPIDFRITSSMRPRYF